MRIASFSPDTRQLRVSFYYRLLHIDQNAFTVKQELRNPCLYCLLHIRFQKTRHHFRGRWEIMQKTQIISMEMLNINKNKTDPGTHLSMLTPLGTGTLGAFLSKLGGLVHMDFAYKTPIYAQKITRYPPKPTLCSCPPIFTLDTLQFSQIPYRKTEPVKNFYYKTRFFHLDKLCCMSNFFLIGKCILASYSQPQKKVYTFVDLSTQN